jgi:hypothetical protein
MFSTIYLNYTEGQILRDDKNIIVFISNLIIQNPFAFFQRIRRICVHLYNFQEHAGQALSSEKEIK